jgi:hypothetical protein
MLPRVRAHHFIVHFVLNSGGLRCAFEHVVEPLVAKLADVDLRGGIERVAVEGRRRVAAVDEIPSALALWPPMEQPQPQPTLRISIDEQTAQGHYVNFAHIIHSPSEFVIDLGRIMPGQTDVKVYSRVIMTPLHAKQLLEALAQNVAIFEQKYGAIHLEEPGFSSNEPSN